MNEMAIVRLVFFYYCILKEFLLNKNLRMNFYLKFHYAIFIEVNENKK